MTEHAPADDLGFQAAIERDPLAGAHFTAGPHQRFPYPAARVQRPHQQNLDFALPAGAMAVEPRGKNARIVQYKAIAGAEELRQVAKGAVLPAPRRAVHHEHARRRTVRQRLLRDQLLGKLVVEFR